MRRSYTTIGRAADVELEIKHSRFLARLRRVSTEADARAVVAERRRAHADARHHCSAFIVGPDARTERSSDDGEPGGTAGVPMVGVLRHHGLTDVVAVVTRYFGGVKLGAGGLVRAYGDAVTRAVEVAGTCVVPLTALFSLRVPIARAGTLEGQLRSLRLPGDVPVVVVDTVWAQEAHYTLAVPDGSEADLRAVVAGLSGGTLTPTPAGERWG